MTRKIGFFDDSGSHTASEYYVLAGFIAPVSDWEIVNTDWARALDKAGLRYFKMREAMALEGQFERGWNPRLRDQFILKLVDIIEAIDPTRIECWLKRADFDTFVRGIVDGSAFNDPYFLLFYHLILSVAANRELNWNSDCDFVFDEQGKVADDAVKRWSWVKQNIDKLQATDISQYLGSSPLFRDDVKVRPLQAADMFAWLLRDCLVKKAKNLEKISRTAITRLEGRKILRIDISKELLMKLGASFLIGKARLDGYL